MRMKPPPTRYGDQTFHGVVAGVAMAALAPSLWSRRLHDADADALRYRLLAAQLRPRQSQIRALRERVLAALSDEAAALDALEAAAERQQEQQQHALKYGQYLNVLSLSARGRRKRRQHQHAAPAARRRRDPSHALRAWRSHCRADAGAARIPAAQRAAPRGVQRAREWRPAPGRAAARRGPAAHAPTSRHAPPSRFSRAYSRLRPPSEAAGGCAARVAGGPSQRARGGVRRHGRPRRPRRRLEAAALAVCSLCGPCRLGHAAQRRSRRRVDRARRSGGGAPRRAGRGRPEARASTSASTSASASAAAAAAAQVEGREEARGGRRAHDDASATWVRGERRRGR